MNAINNAKIDSKGYVVLENFLNNSQLTLFKRVAKELQLLPEALGGPMKYFEKSLVNNKECINRVEYFLENYPDLKILIQEILVKFLNSFGLTYGLFKEKINYKMPNCGGFNPHQDSPAFTRFIRDEMFTVMIPMQKTTKENGCLQVSDNFFDKKILPHENGKIRDDTIENVIWKNIELNQGDIIIFSSYLIHKSEQNKTRSARICYFLTFNNVAEGDVREEYFQYKREQFPPRIERKDNSMYDGWKKNLAREII